MAAGPGWWRTRSPYTGAVTRKTAASPANPGAPGSSPRPDTASPSRQRAAAGLELDAAVRTAASGELPDELLETAARRLQGIALVGAALSVLTLLEQPLLGGPGGAGALAVTLLGASALVSLALRLPRLTLTAKRDLGYLYVTLACFLLDLARLRVTALEPTGPGVSLAVVLMLAFAALVPTSRRAGVALAVAFAALDPLALAFVSSQAQRAAQAALVLGLWPTYFSAALAVGISRAVYGLNERIERARRIGSYELVEKLGSGGMAEVWRARHRMLARPAAVKLIRPRALLGHGPEGAQRLVRLFLREARATSELSSPHTIQLYDFGVAREGTFYFVMELLEGVDFQALVERFGPLPEARVSHLLAQAAESLSEAHQKNFVHRDVKPANLFACRLGGLVDFVKVLDFGLVLDRHPTVEELDDERRFVGTPAIMAPELVRFQAPVDARADIYALGCVGYWLLTGRRVFEAETRQDMLVMHAHQRPVPPSRRVGRDLHPGLEALVMACLEKNPDKRPQSCHELRDDLRALSFEQPWSEERAQAWWRTYAPIGAPASTS